MRIKFLVLWHILVEKITQFHLRLMENIKQQMREIKQYLTHSSIHKLVELHFHIIQVAPYLLIAY